jgi:hypothetical protein
LQGTENSADFGQRLPAGVKGSKGIGKRRSCRIVDDSIDLGLMLPYALLDGRQEMKIGNLSKIEIFARKLG